jgi:hypothetical protein
MTCIYLAMYQICISIYYLPSYLCSCIPTYMYIYIPTPGLGHMGMGRVGFGRHDGVQKIIWTVLNLLAGRAAWGKASHGLGRRPVGVVRCEKDDLFSS